MRWALKVYGQGVKIAFRQILAYRADFLLSTALSILENLALPLVTLMLYGAGAAFPGWTMHEALLIQGIFIMCTGLARPLFFSMVWITMDRVRSGTYDLLLIKPGSVIVHTLALAFDPEGIGVFLSGIAISGVALWHLPPPGFLEIMLFVFLFLMGVIVMLGMVLILSATSFKWVGNSRLFEVFDSVTAFGRYPGSIYPKGLLVIISTLMPVAMLGFFPAAALIGRFEPYMLLAAVPCCLFMLGGVALFLRMVQSYKSAGG